MRLLSLATRTPEDTLRYEVIAKGPVVFTTLRHPPREDRVMEYECLDGNIDAIHIVPDK